MYNQTEGNSGVAGLTPELLPLSALLSKVLVAFTIEFDNEFERLMPHRMAISRALGRHERGPWLVSRVMWINFLRFVDDKPRTVGEMGELARTTTLPLAGMERWGYIVLEPNPACTRPKPRSSDLIVRPTSAGRQALEIWRPLTGVIETRWQARFGQGALDRLHLSLSTLVRQIDDDLPDYLPILGYGLWTKTGLPAPRLEREFPRGDASHLDLPALLSKALLAFTAEFEAESRLSLGISANVLRVIGEEGIFVRDLPLLTGVSKEAVSVSVGFLEREGFATVEPDPSNITTKRIRLTVKGQKAQDEYHKLLDALETRWVRTLGSQEIARLKQALEALFLVEPGQSPRISQGLAPHSDGWRASRTYAKQTAAVIHDPRSALPHFPLVTHRGGFPDGS